MSFRTRNQIVLAGVQAAKGTEETLTVGSNAIKVQPAEFQTNMQSIQTDYVTGGLDDSQPEPGGGGVAMRLPCYLKGSGTAGTAPDLGVLLRGCAMSETTTGTAVTGTAAAGASGTITLDAGASSVDDAYRGMIIQTTGGTGSGQTRVITDYVGSTKVATVTPAWDTTPDNTTTFAIPINVLYRPVSTGTELLTLVRYMRNSDGSSDAIRKRLFDGAGTFSIRGQSGQLCMIDFNFTGRLPAVPDDVSDPGSPTYGGGTPKALLGVSTYLGDSAVKWSEFSFDLGGEVTQQDDPSDSYGMDAAEMVRRSATGRIVPRLALRATRDAFTDWRNGTTRHFWVTWGSTAGERVSLLIPGIKYTGNEEQDVRGHAAEGLPFAASRADDACFICLW